VKPLSGLVQAVHPAESTTPRSGSVTCTSPLSVSPPNSTTSRVRESLPCPGTSPHGGAPPWQCRVFPFNNDTMTSTSGSRPGRVRDDG
jgi:hypothetical protein